MTTAAALKAHATRRLQRAEQLGVELETEMAFDVFSDEDFSFETCPNCNEVMGVTHVCASKIREAREAVLSTQTPALRRWGWAWITFVIGEGQRPTPPRGVSTRALELRIAGLGLADPNGIAYGADNLRKRRRPRRHTRTGKMPETLRRHLADQRNHRSGRMY